jgi:hypothetical protein
MFKGAFGCEHFNVRRPSGAHYCIDGNSWASVGQNIIGSEDGGQDVEAHRGIGLRV